LETDVQRLLTVSLSSSLFERSREWNAAIVIGAQSAKDRRSERRRNVE
jgi:hypothetical protein